MLDYPPYFHAVHDEEGAPLLDGLPGWVVISEELGADPNDHSGRDYSHLKAKGLGVIVRLNYNHHGQGTIPAPQLYRDFANRCRNFVAASNGIDVVIIGNEPNCKGEWVVIDGKPTPIDPTDYARCYSECFFAINSLHKPIRVLVAALAPWNNQSGDWLDYVRRVINHLPFDFHGFALHAYTHGSDPALIASEEIVHGWHWHFRVYRDQMDVINELIPINIPLFIGITETDQNDPWLDADNGWCVAAAQEIHSYNQTAKRPISVLAYYRGGPHDKWSYSSLEGVKRDIRHAASLRLPIPPASTSPQPTPAPIPDPTPDPAPSPKPEHEQSPYLTRWDPRLDARGTQLGVYVAASGAEAGGGRIEGPGDTNPHVTEGHWFDEDEAQGRVNVFLTVLDENGELAVGVPVHWYWDDDGPGEQDVRPTERKFDPWLGREYSLDFAMHHTAPTYGFYIEGQPSDRVSGLGLGDLTRPGMKIHTAYAFTIQFLKNKAVEPIPAPQPEQPSWTAYVLPSIGANVRREPVVAEGNIVTSIPHGEPVQVFGVDDSGGSLWAHVRYSAAARAAGAGGDGGDFTGWVLDSLLGEQPTPTPAAQPGQPGAVPALAHPVAGPRWRNVTQPYGRGVNADYYRQYTVDGVPLEGHNGIDFGTPINSLIQVVDGGRVSQVFDEGSKGFGRGIVVEHPWGQSLYAHLNEQLVSIGDRVSKGDTIATSGNTGKSTGPHLHFGMRVNPYNRKDGMGGYADPAPYLINTQIPPPQPAPAESGLIDPIMAEALFQVESQGEGFVNEKLKIRLEAHIFEDTLRNKPLFDQYFRYNPDNVLAAEYRLNDKSPWVPYHEGGQTGEWAAFELASRLNETAALLSTSMGAPQIMGFHYADIGYDSPQAMFAAFGRSLLPQILSFFRLCQVKPGLIKAMQRRDMEAITRLYNGEGMEHLYIPRLAKALKELGGS